MTDKQDDDFFKGRTLAARKARKFNTSTKGKRIPPPAGAPKQQDASQPPQPPKVKRARAPKGDVRMVEVGDKPVVHREAEAEGFLRLTESTVAALERGEVAKGDPFPVAKVAAIQAVKNTPDLVPLCHPLPVTGTGVHLTLEPRGVHVRVQVRADGKTGVEMEALAGVTAALLTVWDMVKSLEKTPEGQYPDTRIEDVRVLRKVKGDA